jgi:low temperature requirement protein LtrA
MSPTLWQPPRLYTDAFHGEHDERKIGWLELFYDLVYVATLIQLGDALSEDVSIGGVLRFVALFIPIWWSWTGMTFYSNRFITDDLLHRVLIFAQILAIAAMGISVKGAFGDLYVQFTLSYVAVRLVLVLLYVRVARSLPEGAPFARRYALGFFIASMVWLVGAFVPAPYYVIFWILGMIVDFSVPLSKRSRKLNADLPIDVHHMMERYGIFVIIVLGESFVKVLSSISGSVLTAQMGIFGVFAIVVVGGLWWLYFDDVAGVPLRATGAAAYVWIYSHLPITIALTAFGVGLKKLFLEIDHSYVPAKYRWLIGLSMILYLVFVGVINLGLAGSNRGISRQTRSVVRFGGAAAILALILLSGRMSATTFMALSAVVFSIQIAVELVADQQPEHATEGTSA